MNLDLNRLLYDFDLNGFFVVEDVLGEALRSQLTSAWEERAPDVPAFDICFGWGAPWTNLLSEGLFRLDPVLTRILGKCYKLDHAFCVTEGFYSSPDKLHYQSHMVDSGIIYTVKKHRPYTTLLTVGFALLPVEPMKGGFCCVPGSHKAEFECPPEFYQTMKNPHVRQIPQKSGSCVAFTEALTHGTYPEGHDVPRRGILIRLTPAGVQFRRPPGQRPNLNLPTIFKKIAPTPIEIDSLDEYSKSILTRPASMQNSRWRTNLTGAIPLAAARRSPQFRHPPIPVCSDRDRAEWEQYHLHTNRTRD
ncbi:MAG: hypothetical protein GXX91_06240 [Verrucomicrobiaceae bacterium]|nr:hypothetical protein [Verrucomicrobiaceae bacterium]